jgi:trk system potassium uptake protein TrkH
MEPNMSVIDCFFQSVTARTAGFNTIEIDKLTPPSKLLLVLLMIIGASPGGTGGGVKTTTFILALLASYKVIRGNYRLVLFKREIPRSQVLQAYSLLFAYMGVLLFSIFLLSHQSTFDLLDITFESASALGTVGLSVGVSPNCNTISKLLLVFCMYAGRIGPSALILSLMQYERETQLNYPQENIIVG